MSNRIPGGGMLSRLFGGEIETYGFNEIIRQYCDYPEYLPLPVNIYHGWYIHPPRASDLASPRSLTLTFNKRQANEWRMCSNKPVAVFGAPFVHYRRMMNICKSKNAEGTIVYPGHDATSNNFEFDQEKFCSALADLGAQYHPVTVSVHEMDIANGKDKMYREFGFRTFNPGPRKSIEFCKNFYAELSKYRYSCGNHFGSNILYSVEMGIPFFFLGELGRGVLRSSNQPVVYQRTPEQLALLDHVRTLFSEPVDEVSPEQRRLIEEECGIEDCLQPNELKTLLLGVFFKQEVPNAVRRIMQRVLMPRRC